MRRTLVPALSVMATLVSSGAQPAQAAPPAAAPPVSSVAALGILAAATAQPLPAAKPTAWGFSPNGDGRSDAWAMDVVVAAGTSIRLDLRGPRGTLVRNLLAVEAGPRRLSWDARDGSGVSVPDGRYTWSLSGVDSAGQPLVTPSGATTYTGVVWLRRVGSAGVVVVPEVAATSTAYTDRIPVSWRAVSNPDGHTMRYDIRFRGASADSPFSAPSVYVHDVASTSELFRFPAAIPQVPERTLQLSVRTRDALGNIGAWSPWRGTARALDDSSTWVERGAGWTRVANPGAFNGSVLRASTAGRTLSTQGYGRVVSILATRCPTCGRLRVTVDGRAVVVDTRSSQTTHRQVVARVVVPTAEHHVQVTTVATSGRPITMVDGFAFLR